MEYSQPEERITLLRDLGMSNYDHSIDVGLAEALQAAPGAVCARYTAYNFCAEVYFTDGQFRAGVWCYQIFQETIAANTPEELMTAVSDKYGWD